MCFSKIAYLSIEINDELNGLYKSGQGGLLAFIGTVSSNNVVVFLAQTFVYLFFVIELSFLQSYEV